MYSMSQTASNCQRTVNSVGYAEATHIKPKKMKGGKRIRQASKTKFFWLNWSSDNDPFNKSGRLAANGMREKLPVPSREMFVSRPCPQIISIKTQIKCN